MPVVTVDEYLEAAPEPQRSTLAALRATLRSLLPDAEEGMSYGVPAFKIGGVAIAGYAYHKAHCGYYPHSEAVLAELAEELAEYDWSAGTLRFPLDRTLPEPLVALLVERRLAEIG